MGKILNVIIEDQGYLAGEALGLRIKNHLRKMIEPFGEAIQQASQRLSRFHPFFENLRTRIFPTQTIPDPKFQFHFYRGQTILSFLFNAPLRSTQAVSQTEVLSAAARGMRKSSGLQIRPFSLSRGRKNLCGENRRGKTCTNDTPGFRKGTPARGQAPSRKRGLSPSAKKETRTLFWQANFLAPGHG